MRERIAHVLGLENPGEPPETVGRDVQTDGGPCGIEGGELMAVVQVAMMGKVPAAVLREAIFAHPTLAESLNNVLA